jgi:predicted  nucleic acid-binding Zn-ribbon protein
MGSEAIASIRTRAELARRLSTEIKDPAAQQALREIADALEAEAESLEHNIVLIKEAVRPKG